MKTLLRSTLLIALLASSASAFAQATDSMDAEREALSRIQYELQQLQTQVRDAARNAPTGTRVQFRYDWLASDLELINRSIRDHLDAPRQPRPIPPLKGDYRN